MVDDCVGRVYLSHLHFSFVTYEDIGGRSEEGIFIPFRYNAIRRIDGKKPIIILDFFARKIYRKKTKETHLLVQKMDFYRQNELRKYGLDGVTLGGMFAYKNNLDKSCTDIDAINSIINEKVDKDRSFEMKLLSRMVDEYDFSDYKYEQWKIIDIRRNLRNLLIKMENYINNDNL